MPDSQYQPEPSPEERFAQLVREKREALGWSQEELAKRVSAATGTTFHQTGITRIEKLARGIRLNEALVLASVLSIDLGPLAKTLNDHRQNEENVRNALAAAKTALAEQQEVVYRLREESDALTARYEAAERRMAMTQGTIAHLEMVLQQTRLAIAEQTDGQ